MVLSQKEITNFISSSILSYLVKNMNKNDGTGEGEG